MLLTYELIPYISDSGVFQSVILDIVHHLGFSNGHIFFETGCFYLKL